MYLAQNLKYLRGQKGVNQKELSDALGLTSSAVTMWERERRTPDIETIIKLSTYFNITLDDLILKNLAPPVPIYAANLRYLRTKHGMTQKDMADLLGYRGKQGYDAIENGKTKLSVDDLKISADFFGVTLEQLVKQDLSKEQ